MRMQNVKIISTVTLDNDVALYSLPEVYTEDEFQKSDKYKWYKEVKYE